MDVYIRQLTHDNNQFDHQWPQTFDRLHTLSLNFNDANMAALKLNALDALVDYILIESQLPSNPSQVKCSFVNVIIENFVEEGPIPSLVDLVRIFRRVLDVANVFDSWHLVFLKTFYRRFCLGERLSSTSSVHLIQSIFLSLQNHSFSNQQANEEIQEQWKDFLSSSMFSQSSYAINRLNNEQTMLAMRPAFQQLFRCAAWKSHQSKVWSEIVWTLSSTLPTLFYTYANPADSQHDLAACIRNPLSSDYIGLVVKAYHSQVDLFKLNAPHIITVIEQLIKTNNIKEAGRFMDEVLLKHFDSASVDLENVLRMLIRTCPLVDVDHRDELCQIIISSMSHQLSDIKCNKKLASIFFDFVLTILELRVMAAPECACRVLQKADFYPWKELASRLADLLRVCSAYDTLIQREYFGPLNTLEKIIGLIVERAKVYTVIYRATHDVALQSVLRWSLPAKRESPRNWSVHVYSMGRVMLDLIDQQQINADICARFIEALQRRATNSDDDQDGEINRPFFVDLASRLGTYMELLKNLPHAIHIQLAKFILTALAQPLQTENGTITFEHLAVLNIWFKISSCIITEADVRVYEPCAVRIHAIACNEEEKNLFQWWTTFWSVVGIKYPDVAANHVEQFLDDLLIRKDLGMYWLILTLYAKRPASFHARLDKIVNDLFDDNMSYAGTLAYIFLAITKEHPELITATHVDHLFAAMEKHPSLVQQLYIVIQALAYVANARPYLFYKHHAQLLNLIVKQQHISVYTCLHNYLIASTLIGNEQTANESLSILINLLRSGAMTSTDVRKQIFHTCQLIGLKYKRALAAKRADLAAFQWDYDCQVLLNFIDGNKLSEENQATINRTRDEIIQMEKRVVNTERNVGNVIQVVKKQDLKVTDLGGRVGTIGTHLSNVADQVETHRRDIARIDAKTLSFVPAAWGSKVCVLLNYRAENDWRLLGRRFGYSTSELKHWALQADPTMALLNEWFMTHKADEATYGLVKMLGEIGRYDVEQIIREAVISTGEIIPEDMPIDIKRLPPVFLSYQWGSQQAVLQLKYHLEAAGYLCWMDTGQMGGGDKLFAKIDAGIRGAKVVICCMNSAYAQSDNCSREVHLCINTGKPLIPLQMEKQTWPPEGALGPIMSEYLFIRFYDRKNKDSTEFWPEDKFSELLGQIRYHVAPDPDMISDRYHNWFLPRIDNLIFLQPTVTGNNNEKQALKVDDIPLVVSHPQIMISYQWDRQSDIVTLYKKLTQLGYGCWLDIFQMGGGDSLFEKIDNGIRHASCILACVTPKYTKSINCRREMALADALTKPIIPLLLEETSTWPPSGPMAMVFAEKLYINFRHEKDIDKSDIWMGNAFEQLLAQLKKMISEVQTETPR